MYLDDEKEEKTPTDNHPEHKDEKEKEDCEFC